MSHRSRPAQNPALRAFKRLMDLVGATGLLILMSPVVCSIGMVIALVDGRPVIFKHQRPGRDERLFTMYKFRTMRSPSAEQDTYRTDSERVTALGSFLRRTSLDELPELVNVIKGDMSLVGPRPLLVEYLPNYSDPHRRRHLVRPGVTGLAQVSGRRSLPMSQRLDLDVHYVDHWSPLLDLRILARTLTMPFRSGPDESQSIDEVDDLGLFKR